MASGNKSKKNDKNHVGGEAGVIAVQLEAARVAFAGHDVVVWGEDGAGGSGGRLMSSNWRTPVAA